MLHIRTHSIYRLTSLHFPCQRTGPITGHEATIAQPKHRNDTALKTVRALHLPDLCCSPAGCQDMPCASHLWMRTQLKILWLRDVIIKCRYWESAVTILKNFLDKKSASQIFNFLMIVEALAPEHTNFLKYFVGTRGVTPGPTKQDPKRSQKPPPQRPPRSKTKKLDTSFAPVGPPNHRSL